MLVAVAAVWAFSRLRSTFRNPPEACRDCEMRQICKKNTLAIRKTTKKICRYEEMS